MKKATKKTKKPSDATMQWQRGIERRLSAIESRLPAPAPAAAPAPKEIDAYLEAEAKKKQEEEWASVSELQNMDACVCSNHEQDELRQLGSEFLYNSVDRAPNMRWDTDYKRHLIETSAPHEFNPCFKLNWIPFSEFKRRLQGTVARLEAEDLDVLRDELELLGSMLRAERITATVDNRKCTDEQLERCYALRDKISAPSPSVEQRVEEIGKVVEEIVREWHRKHGQGNCTHIEVHAVPSNWNALHRIAASHLTSLLSNK